MPALVEARSHANPWEAAPPASAGGGPWGGGGWGGGGEVAAGGFGGGTPAMRSRRMPGPGTPHPGAHYAATPASAPPPLSGPPDNPWLAAPPAQYDSDPFSMPAASFDRPGGYSGSPGFTPWAAGPAPTMSAGMPAQQDYYAPYTPTYTPTNGLENGLDELGEDGWTQFRRMPPEEKAGYFAQSPGVNPAPGLSPAPSTSSTLTPGPRAQYKRPDEWRPEFTLPRPGTLSRLLSMGKGSGDTCE